MTPRAVRILQEADIIAAEDTRHSRVLLTHFNITTPMFSCHKFNEEKRGDFFVSKMLEGKTVALISDAGTPCISDPGFRLVKMAADAGVDVAAVCGASAVVAALSVSGFDVSRFEFIGFLPRKKREVVDCLSAAFPGTVVFYESPKRILDTLEVISENFPQAKVCICNDLTKKFEQSYRGDVADVLARLKDNPNTEKGEYACVVNMDAAGFTEEKQADDTPSLESQIVDIMIKTGGNQKKKINNLSQLEKKRTKKEIYSAMLNLKKLFGDSDE